MNVLCHGRFVHSKKDPFSEGTWAAAVLRSSSSRPTSLTGRDLLEPVETLGVPPGGSGGGGGGGGGGGCA